MNRDGKFNVKRHRTAVRESLYSYNASISMPAWAFVLVTLFWYLMLSVVFAVGHPLRGLISG